jgi:RimJ/RimL family protein N-acetyltransferase
MYSGREQSSRYEEFNDACIPLLIVKKNGSMWEICHKTELNDNGYPRRIGIINGQAGLGMLSNSTKLGWQIEAEYRKMGIMKAVLKAFLLESQPAADGFEVRIARANIASIRLAEAAGFVMYYEGENSLFYIKR